MGGLGCFSVPACWPPSGRKMEKGGVCQERLLLCGIGILWAWQEFLVNSLVKVFWFGSIHIWLCVVGIGSLLVGKTWYLYLCPEIIFCQAGGCLMWITQDKMSARLYPSFGDISVLRTNTLCSSMVEREESVCPVGPLTALLPDRELLS
jgi:hypothetical protein